MEALDLPNVYCRGIGQNSLDAGISVGISGRQLPDTRGNYQTGLQNWKIIDNTGKNLTL